MDVVRLWVLIKSLSRCIPLVFKPIVTTGIILYVLLISVPRSHAGTVLGPLMYHRDSGAPETLVETFDQNLTSCAEGSAFELVVVNGDPDGGNRISSATILLNGDPVITPDGLNQNVAEIRKPITLAEENGLQVKLAGTPGGYLAVSVECVANCLEVSITYPLSGAILHQDRTRVEGTINSTSAEVGVRAGNTFGAVTGPPYSYVVPKVFLQEGANTVTVTATSDCGMQATASIEVNVPKAEEPRVLVLHNPENGVAPLSVHLKALAVPPNPVKSYAWNISGDTGAETDVTYDTPGIYMPEVTVTDVEDQTYTATVVVNVWDRDALDARLLGKWNGLRDALAAGDAEAAERFFSYGSRDKYKQIFEAVGDELAQVGQDLGDIALVEFRSTSAKYRVQREDIVDGVPTTLTFWVYFILDGDGIWRIMQF